MKKEVGTKDKLIKEQLERREEELEKIWKKINLSEKREREEKERKTWTGN